MTTKLCPKCNEERDISFYYYNKTYNIYHSACKLCEILRGKELIKNSPTRKAIIRERNKVRNNLCKKETKEKIDQIKLNRGCLVCGYKTFPGSLLFHHIDPTSKIQTVGNLRINGKKIITIEKEIAKCVVLCFNCHIALHNRLITLPS